MSISISNYPVHLQDGFKPNRECLKSQGSQSEYQKVFHRDSLEVSQLSKNREILMDKIKHTVVQSAASLSDMRAGRRILTGTLRRGKRVFVSLPQHPIKSKRRGTRLIRSHKNFYLIRTEIRRKKKSR